jgi:ABC-type sugar transport system substrate-binding protein
MILRVVRHGTTVVVVTARDPSPYVAHLRRLERAGCPVVVVACGPAGAADAARARAAGLAARTARLDGPWRTAARLAMSS